MLSALFQWIQGLSVSTTIHESALLYPAIQSIHLYSMILLVTVIAAFDLRLLGLAMGRQPVSQLAGRLLRVAWLSLGGNAVTGALLFASDATNLYVNPYFQIKLLLIVLALAFHSVVRRRAARWDDAPAMPIGAKLAGCFSLLLWIGVIAAARWIAYV